MKQLLPKLKKINWKKLISKKKSQIDRATRAHSSNKMISFYPIHLVRHVYYEYNTCNHPYLTKTILEMLYTFI